MNLKLMIGVILMLSSFSSVKLGRSSASIIEEGARFPSKYLYTDSKKVAYFTSDEFTSKASNNYSIAKINEEYRFLKLSKEAFVNMHDPSILDTIYTFANRKNNIQIYRARHADLFIRFDATDSRLKLADHIYSGMSKNDFCQKFLITESVHQKVQIGNSEATMKFIFTFKNNRLKSIKSDFYLD